MYAYSYEKITCSYTGWGAIVGASYDIKDYRSIIDARAKEGWRYVGYIPTRQRGSGHTEELELIFEKEIT